MYHISTYYEKNRKKGNKIQTTTELLPYPSRTEKDLLNAIYNGIQDVLETYNIKEPKKVSMEIFTEFHILNYVISIRSGNIYYLVVIKERDY